MSPYVIVDTSNDGDPESRPNTAAKVIIYDGDVVPVFSSRELTLEFIRTHHSAEESTRLMQFEVDPIRLAVLVDGPEHEHLYLIFDPVDASPGRWTSARKPMSAQAYRRYMRELVRGVKKLFAEGREKLGEQIPDPEERERILAVWGVLQADSLAANARACAEEHHSVDDLWSREDPDSPTY